MQDFGGGAQLRYVDFDGPELSEYPEVQQKVAASELEPGVIMVGGELVPIWNFPYTRMIEEFERLGAERVSKVS